MMFAFWRSLNSVAASDECRQTILDGIEPRCNVGVMFWSSSSLFEITLTAGCWTGAGIFVPNNSVSKWYSTGQPLHF
jgi:hypothetical protein